MHVCLLILYVYVQEPKEGAGSSRTGAIGSCEPQYGCGGLNPGPL